MCNFLSTLLEIDPKFGSIFQATDNRKEWSWWSD